jgi:erythromycin esterase-like protein
MKSLALCLAFLVAVSCSNSKPPEDSTPEWLFELPPAPSLTSSDLDPIRTAVGEKRVVMMGEAIHVTSELSRVRERLIRKLHESADFNLLLFEGSPVEFWIAEEEFLSSKPGPESAGNFQRTALFGIWQTDEIRALIEYAQRTQAGAGSSDLYVSSYDVQIGQGRRFVQGKRVFETLIDLLQKRDKRITTAEEEAVQPLENLAFCQQRRFPESDEQYIEAEQGIQVLSQLVARAVRTSSNSDLHEKMLALLPKAASYTLEFCREAIQNTRNYSEVRDEWASRQFADFISTLNQKALVWAHSAHVRQWKLKEGRTSFGAHVRGTFPEEVFAIQVTAGNGRAFVTMDDKGKEIEPAEKPLLPLEKVSLERKLSALSTMDFFVASKDLPAEFGPEETTRSEPESVRTIDPRKDFDGYYFVQTTTASRLTN